MIGRTLGHYRVESQLGAGGMGVVYRAHDTTLDRTVAIKVVGERSSSDPKARDRLLREARTASALNHPHICTIHEVGEAEDQVFIAMEYVEGGSLSALLSEPRPTEMVVRYGLQIADALAHAHDRGIVHRDLKTSNVMLTPEGRTKVLDFGLAKRLPREELAEQPTRSGDSLTEAGQVVGTLHYIAPEVLRGQPADARADIWALGVLLYELATGDLPFRGKTRFEVTHAILGEAPTVLPERVPAGLRAVIQRCLAKEPSQRYQRASEVRAALEAIESGSAAVPWVRPARRRLFWGACALTAAALLAAGGLSYFGGRGRSIDSIAVLPLSNAGGDPDTEYLSDGIAEGVISSLSKLPGLKVIAFSSVVRYSGRTVDPKEVVRDLGVDAVLTGRVVQRGDTVSIHAELVNTHDGRRLWGEQYDAKMSGILTVQDDIAEKISGQLRSRLTTNEKQRLTTRDAENTEAYQLYLKGHHYLDKGTREDYEKSLEFFRRAIEKDPGYAPAYFGTADAYGGMTWEGMLPPAEGFAQNEGALETGLRLDDTAGKGHSNLAWLRWGRDWDYAAADKEWRRAVALDPHDPFIRRSYAKFLRSQGRWEEAIEEMKQGQALDPLGLETNNTLGHTYYWARRYDEAIDQAKKTLEIDPKYAPAHQLLAELYARKGMYQEAIAEQQQTFVLNDDSEGAQGLEEDFKALGFEPVMQQLYRSSIDAFKEAAKTHYVSPIGFAVNYAKLGDKDQAFAWLDKAYADRSPWLVLLKEDPDFDGLRSDPRFDALLKRVGLTS